MNTTATTKTRNAEGTRKGTLRAFGSTPSAGSMKILTHAKITRDRLGAVNDVLRLSSSVGSERAVDNREVIGSNPISGTTRWHSTDASPTGSRTGCNSASKTENKGSTPFDPAHYKQQPEQRA